MSLPGADAASAATADALDFGQLTSLRAAAKRNDPQALKQAAQQFEAMFTEMLLKTANETKFGDDLTGQQGEFYQDMFNQQMALHLSSGKGLGLADMLVRQLNGLHGGSGAQAQDAAAPSASTDSTASSDAASPADQPGWKPKSAQEFVDAIRPHAEKAAAELGVPARALIAQAALETGWGKHMATQKDGGSGYNLFGVKATGWSGASQTAQTSEYENGQWSSQQASFRSYGSIGQSFDDYVQMLKNNPRYADALRSGDVHGFAHGLQKAGYATDPHYAQKLMKVAYGAQMNGAYSGSVVNA
jgi:peptidoglycan hydrolase FlgJ